jgi:hypothetical protein
VYCAVVEGRDGRREGFMRDCDVRHLAEIQNTCCSSLSFFCDGIFLSVSLLHCHRTLFLIVKKHKCIQRRVISGGSPKKAPVSLEGHLVSHQYCVFL